LYRFSIIFISENRLQVVCHDGKNANLSKSLPAAGSHPRRRAGNLFTRLWQDYRRQVNMMAINL
jgi:hypothetical protein